MKYIKEPANRFTYKWYSCKYDKVCDVIYVQDGDSVCFMPDEMSSGILTSINRDNGILMPCTGFEDINGIPIYEGYLLKNKDGLIDVVEWYYGNFVWNGQALSSFDECYMGDIWAQESKEMKIVGNIYEDAGLLNPASIKGQMKLDLRSEELVKENAELKAENKRLKELKCKFKEYCTCNTEKYVQCLQEIKEKCNEARRTGRKAYLPIDILDVITKAEVGE